MSLDLLVLGPHPDDAELCAGGWLALCAQRKQKAAIVDLTRGEAASRGTVPIRADEAAAAAAVLGLAFRENLGLPDTGLDATSDIQVAEVVKVFRAHRPTLVVAPWIEARHPDHSAAGRLAQRAHFLAGLKQYRPELGAPFRPRRLLHAAHRQDARPDFVVDISSVIETKRQAVACHVSQLGDGAATDRLIGQALGVGAFEVRDRYWGATIGVAFGEPYVLGAPVPVSDPVEHFSVHAQVPVLRPPR